MLVFSDSQAYCNFAGSAFKYLWFSTATSPIYTHGGNWWNESAGIFFGPAWTGSGTLTGLVDVGPYPGTSSLHFKLAHPLWAQSIYAGPAKKASWITGFWVYAKNISATKTLLVWQNSDSLPNYGTTFSLGIKSDGHVVCLISANPNINVNAAQFDPQNSGGTVVMTSNQTIPINTIDPTPGSLRGWAHICLVANFLGGGSGTARLFINGCNDAFVSGGNFFGANLLTLMWNNPSGPDEVCVSQLIVNDSSGPQNNAQVSQFATMQVPFPTSDVVTQWSSTAATGYGAVNGNPGPNADFISLPSLATPDELFGMSAVAAVPQVVGVALNMSLLASSQTVAGLFQAFGHVRTPTTTIPGLNVSGPYTRQAFSELNPWTGQPWTIADINAAAWGVRGISGISEQIGQYFLEVIGQTGPANCGGSYIFGA